MLSIIQGFDPCGVGAVDLKECLLIQLKAKGMDKTIEAKVVGDYLPLLKKMKYKEISKKLKVSVERIKTAVQRIAHLEPKPGRSFCIEKPIYPIPDLILQKNGDEFELIINEQGLPPLCINTMYKKMMKNQSIPEQTRQYIRERLNSANILIKALNSRRHLIRIVVEELIRHQKEFFENEGGSIKAITIDRIAKAIGRHKSTVSRAISGKYIQTPQGIFELRYFFDRGIRQKDGTVYSSKDIKRRIFEIIKNEDRQRPISDKKITQILNNSGISISQRTVTKYRSQLKILPAYLRKR